MRLVAHYTLQVKAIDGTDRVVNRDPKPWQLNRPSLIDRDPGRPWSGDVYETGAPSDPEAAYARFHGQVDSPTGQVEVDAWLDRAPDGTLIGWVTQDGLLWRYTDPEAWALDVDGADLAPVKTDSEKPVKEMADAVDSHAAEDEVDALAGTSADDTYAGVHEAEKALLDAAAGDTPDEGPNPVDVPDADAPVGGEAAAAGDGAATVDDATGDAGDAAAGDPEEDPEDDEASGKPWLKTEKKTLRLVVRPKA